MSLTDPVVLTGALADLRPLALTDHDGLVAAASDGELWQLFYTGVPAPTRCAPGSSNAWPSNGRGR